MANIVSTTKKTLQMMTSKIKLKTLFCLVTLVGFDEMLSLFSFEYFLETEKKKAEILKNTERNKVEKDKIYQSILDRIEPQVNRQNTYIWAKDDLLPKRPEKSVFVTDHANSHKYESIKNLLESRPQVAIFTALFP